MERRKNVRGRFLILFEQHKSRQFLFHIYGNVRPYHLTSKELTYYMNIYKYNKPKTHLRIGTFEPSTQECSECGNVKEGTERLTMDKRIYHCFGCGLVMDRDLNASLVILRKGIIKSTAGHAGSHAFGDIVRPSHMGADVVELGTKFGEPS